MTPLETVSLVRIVHAACPAQKFDEHTPDVWHAMLAAVNFDDAKVAVIRVGQQRPFISPSEIIAEVKRIRASRFAEPGCEQPPPGDPDDIPGFLAGLRAQRRAVADGRGVLPAIEAPKADRQKDLGEAMASVAARSKALDRVKATTAAARQEAAERARTARVVSEDRATARKAAEAELSALRENGARI